MIGELVVERMTPGSDKPALGNFGPSHDVCPVNCCLYPRPTGGPPSRPAAQ
jgi:ferrochelatase